MKSVVDAFVFCRRDICASLDGTSIHKWLVKLLVCLIHLRVCFRLVVREVASLLGPALLVEFDRLIVIKQK